MSTPTSNQIPKCRLCGKNHFARDGCKFGPDVVAIVRAIAAMSPKQKLQLVAEAAKLESPGPLKNEEYTESRDTPREGRRVLKGSTVRGGTAKPTRTASTEMGAATTPAGEILANQTTAEKVRPGKPETALRKRKAKKGRAKK